MVRKNMLEYKVYIDQQVCNWVLSAMIYTYESLCALAKMCMVKCEYKKGHHKTSRFLIWEQT
jgi:hypothetical protein